MASLPQMNASPSGGFSVGTLQNKFGNIYVTPQAVTQITSITTAVTINGTSGVITTVASTLASGGSQAFTVNNTEVVATSAVVATICSYSGSYTTNGLPTVNVGTVAAGSFVINILNPHGANALNGTLQISFFVC